VNELPSIDKFGSRKEDIIKMKRTIYKNIRRIRTNKEQMDLYRLIILTGQYLTVRYSNAHVGGR
jgi:hypothetical protein